MTCGERSVALRAPAEAADARRLGLPRGPGDDDDDEDEMPIGDPPDDEGGDPDDDEEDDDEDPIQV